MMDAPPLPDTKLIAAHAHDSALAEVARVLSADGLAALPTETVYGLAARALSDQAVAALYAAKGRPASNPLIVHVASVTMAKSLCDWTETAEALAAAHWPGPLTLVLKVRPGAVARAALAGGDTIALRVPNAMLVREATQTVGPLVAPSANRSGRVSATSAEAVMAELSGRIHLVVDGGPSPIGVESTVVDVSGQTRLLRPGALTREQLEETLAAPVANDRPRDVIPRSPGLLASHYAPRARLRLNVSADAVLASEGWMALGREESAALPAHTVRLSPSGDLAEVARNLYAAMRTLDAAGVDSIAVSPIPGEGLGAAIRDRLARAAAPRPPQDTP